MKKATTASLKKSVPNNARKSRMTKPCSTRKRVKNSSNDSNSNKKHNSDVQIQDVSVDVFDNMFRNVQLQLGQQFLNEGALLETKKRCGNKKKIEKIIETVEILSSSDDERASHKRGQTKNSKSSSSKTMPAVSSSTRKHYDEIDDLLTSMETPKKQRRNSKKVKARDSPRNKAKATPNRSNNDDIQVLEMDEQLNTWDLLSPNCGASTPTSPEPYTVRIRWKDSLIKLTMCETNYCYELKRRLAEQLELPPDDLIITFDDVTQVFHDRNTLSEANIVFGTILYASRTVSAPSQKSKEVVRNPSLIRIKVQSTEKRGVGFFEIRKSDPLRELQILYSMKMQVSPEQVKFMFDGEVVDMNETPMGLDFEEDECLDVIVS